MKTIRLFNARFSARIHPQGLLWVLLLTLGAAMLIASSTRMGSYPMTLSDVWQTLNGTAESDRHQLIIWEFRLPRTLVALLAGALFALSGAMLQSLTRNALADPSLIGISQGAALAVVTLIVVFPEVGGYWRELSAFAGSLLIAIIIRLIAGSGRSLKFILMGIGLSAFVSAMTSALLTYGDIERAMSALAWLAGSVNSANWQDVHILGVASFVLLFIYLLQARAMSPMALGAETATGLGVNLRRLGNSQLVLAVLAAALATAVVGPLGFVGLLAPHLTRRIINTGPATFLVLVALIGGLLVLAADLIGRTLFAPVQLPAGLLTSIIGAPVFIWLMLHQKTQT